MDMPGVCGLILDSTSKVVHSSVTDGGLTYDEKVTPKFHEQFEADILAVVSVDV